MESLRVEVGRVRAHLQPFSSWLDIKFDLLKEYLIIHSHLEKPILNIRIWALKRYKVVLQVIIDKYLQMSCVVSLICQRFVTSQRKERRGAILLHYIEVNQPVLFIYCVTIYLTLDGFQTCNTCVVFIPWTQHDLKVVPSFEQFLNKNYAWKLWAYYIRVGSDCEGNFRA